MALPLLLAIPMLAAAKPASAVEAAAQAKGVIQQFVNAWNAHQIDRLVQLFTHDGSFKSPAGEGATSRGAIRELLVREHRDIFQQSSLHTSAENVKLPRKGEAIVKGAYTLSGIPVALGFDVSREGTFDFHMTRRDGQWMITAARIAKE